MKKMIAIIALVLVACMAFAGCAKPAEAPAERTQLVVGTSADYPPFEFHILEDGKDKIVGIDMSLAQKIADDMGVELVIKDMSFDFI
ncbi:MAG: transporter substrate-binding domain-containing protein, partial [Clostridia bacterium]|nr:transporter substrate-binding domain-containing protein [Clostridia bacterium]